jgi:hypothetical protein
VGLTRIDLNREFKLKTIVKNEKRLSIENLFKLMEKLIIGSLKNKF